MLDFNGCDALLHAVQKRKLRSFPAPLCTNHLVRDCKRACGESCHSRLIQKCFIRSLQRDADGNVDNTLIPAAINQWYTEEDPSDNEDASDDIEWE